MSAVGTATFFVYVLVWIRPFGAEQIRVHTRAPKLLSGHGCRSSHAKRMSPSHTHMQYSSFVMRARSRSTFAASHKAHTPFPLPFRAHRLTRATGASQVASPIGTAEIGGDSRLHAELVQQQIRRVQ